MKFTDFFIRRPALATALSLIILLLGLRAWTQMETRQYPNITSAEITVTTVYPGAGPETVQAYVTVPLQQAISSASGIDYMTATSEQGQSVITIEMQLGFDPDAALAQILSKVNQVQNLLPAGSLDPRIDSKVGGASAKMWIMFYGDELEQAQVNDYVLRVANPRIHSVPGVGTIDVVPAGTDPNANAYALRVWLDPMRMTARGVVAADVAGALAANNFVSAVGQTRNPQRQISINASTSLHDVDEFKQLVVRSVGTTQVRLEDVADVTLDTQNHNQMSFFNGHEAVAVGVNTTPAANELEVSAGVHAVIDELRQSLPPGLHIGMAYDAAKFINASLEEVFLTIGITLLVVVVVIFLFLGSLRSLLLPAIAIPLAIVGGGLLMLALGFTINLLSLLAIVLAIGLVVDDAIIVLENIQRLIDEGQPPFQAAINGARELATPIIVMTTTVVAVFLPIGFMGGLTGALFTEFAFTLVAAVVISSVIALTLTPMLCSRVLQPTSSTGLTHWLERGFNALRRGYDRSLEEVLTVRPLVLLAVGAVLASTPFLFLGSESELAPDEDQSIVTYAGVGPATATRSYLDKYNAQIHEFLSPENYPETELVWQISGVPPQGGAGANAVFGGANLKDWNERARTQMQLMPLMQGDLSKVTGLQTVAFSQPVLPGAAGLPVQFVLTSALGYDELSKAADTLMGAAYRSGHFAFLQKDLRIDAPAISLDIKRDVAASLGLSMSDIGRNLGTLLSEGMTGRFEMSGRSYQVVPLVPDAQRADINALNEYYLRGAGGERVPLNTVVDTRRTVQAQFLPQFQQLNSVTLQGVAAPGVTLGLALDTLGNLTHSELPGDYSIDYGGQSRQFVQQGSAVILTFVLSILLVYLLMVAQFESFRDPFIVLAAVPMSVFGALVFVYLGFTSLNIYTQVGLITLISLITKQSILVVEFANVIQETEGLDRMEAVKKASSIRLRPIIMTTAAMVFGVVPLLLASGPGAVSRYAIGLVIATGLTIGALISLYVVPVIYSYIAVDKRAQRSAGAISGS
ncbi:acriflavine resistance protein B [Steroidobacter denitrificans]|uniref:Acriflavine resistance protein B n=1 Tax=Steroidobacter denitrificans TaxID=465721 RepID=A0A127F7E4_STEDE|nr:efflux RND transporter permease subunit [Steroidobacter denitrificans]AMN46363.1 acriflavine resistance protein B [Steroidobacter denitrificans]